MDHPSTRPGKCQKIWIPTVYSYQTNSPKNRRLLAPFFRDDVVLNHESSNMFLNSDKKSLLEPKKMIRKKIKLQLCEDWNFSSTPLLWSMKFCVRLDPKSSDYSPLYKLKYATLGIHGGCILVKHDGLSLNWAHFKQAHRILLSGTTIKWYWLVYHQLTLHCRILPLSAMYSHILTQHKFRNYLLCEEKWGIELVECGPIFIYWHIINSECNDFGEW